MRGNKTEVLKPYKIEVKISPNYGLILNIQNRPIKDTSTPIIPRFLTLAEGGPGIKARINLKKVIEIQKSEL